MADNTGQDETRERYTLGEWLHLVRALARALTLVAASGCDQAVIERETGRLKAAVYAPYRRGDGDAAGQVMSLLLHGNTVLVEESGVLHAADQAEPGYREL